jgi:hypothetical protein
MLPKEFDMGKHPGEEHDVPGTLANDPICNMHVVASGVFDRTVHHFLDIESDGAKISQRPLRRTDHSPA